MTKIFIDTNMFLDMYRSCKIKPKSQPFAEYCNGSAVIFPQYITEVRIYSAR